MGEEQDESALMVFQSTHLHEVRLLPRVSLHIRRSSFNPRTYMRCDLVLVLVVAISRCFNPRTYMRCDSRESKYGTKLYVFQSTHLHEVRRCLTASMYAEHIVSIHAPT